MTERFTFGLIGERIGYSRSPSVFSAIFAADGVSGSFRLFDTPGAAFDDEFPRIVSSGLQGLAVTVPYKERVIGYLDDLDETSRVLSAVNSVAVGEQRLGFNTDVVGFGRLLTEYQGDLEGGVALILGAGGAARAAAYALLREFGCESVVIIARNRAKDNQATQRLADQIAGYSTGVRDVIVGSYDRLPGYLAEIPSARWNIVVNATPLGGPNYPGESPLPSTFDWRTAGIYYDLNYNADNQAVARAAAEGVPAFDGSAMLVAQAIESYLLWTGREVEFEAVYREAFPDWRPPRAPGVK